MKHREEEARLLEAIKAMLPKLDAILAQTEEPWGCEDGVYRFYHQSFKVYGLQRLTKDVVEALQAIAPERKLDAWFLEIVSEGTNRTFSTAHNERWLQETRPILEAFFMPTICSRWSASMAASSRAHRSCSQVVGRRS
ncbi:MAG: hypothetical protein WBM46_03045 [Polyangiales bacterium]